MRRIIIISRKKKKGRLDNMVRSKTNKNLFKIQPKKSLSIQTGSKHENAKFKKGSVHAELQEDD